MARPSKLGTFVQKRIKQLREERKLTQAQVCEMAAISIDAMTRIETGRREPSLATLERIADALDVPPSAFFQDATPTPSTKRQTLGRMEALLYAQPERVLTLAEAVVTGLVRASEQKRRSRR